MRIFDHQCLLRCVVTREEVFCISPIWRWSRFFFLQFASYCPLQSFLWLSVNFAQLVWMHFWLVGFCGCYVKRGKQRIRTWKESEPRSGGKKICRLIYPALGGVQTRIQCDFDFFFSQLNVVPNVYLATTTMMVAVARGLPPISELNIHLFVCSNETEFEFIFYSWMRAIASDYCYFLQQKYHQQHWRLLR